MKAVARVAQDKVKGEELAGLGRGRGPLGAAGAPPRPGRYGKMRAAVFDVSGPMGQVGYPVSEEEEDWGDVPSEEGVRALAASQRVDPLANRGSEVTKEGFRWGLHKFEASVFGLPVEAVLEMVASQLPGYDFEGGWQDLFKLAGEAKYYYQRYVGPAGLVVMGGMKCDSTPAHVRVELAGECCEGLGLHVLAGIMQRLQASGCRVSCTALDTAWDGVPVSPGLLDGAIARGDVRCRLKFLADSRGEEHRKEGKCKAWLVKDSVRGTQTAYVNRRGAGWQFSVYDDRGYNRAEFRPRAKRAGALFRALVSAPLDQWPGICLGHLRACLDLVDRRSDVNVSRCSLLPEWAAFVGGVEKVRIAWAEVVRDSDHAAGAVLREELGKCRRAARVMAKFVDTLGAAKVDALIQEERDKQPLDLRRRISARALVVRSAIDGVMSRHGLVVEQQAYEFALGLRAIEEAADDEDKYSAASGVCSEVVAAVLVRGEEEHRRRYPLLSMKGGGR